MLKTSKMFGILLACCLLATLVAACGNNATVTPDPKAPKPSNPGGTGPALGMTGNVQNGQKIFSDRCAECHGDQGKGGIANEGSTDGTIPPLNPIDAGLANSDPKVFAANIDLFIEHGSKPEGPNPDRTMMGFGDLKVLQPQEIADVIAYVISLNKK